MLGCPGHGQQCLDEARRPYFNHRGSTLGIFAILLDYCAENTMVLWSSSELLTDIPSNYTYEAEVGIYEALYDRPKTSSNDGD